MAMTPYRYHGRSALLVVAMLLSACSTTPSSQPTKQPLITASTNTSTTNASTTSSQTANDADIVPEIKLPPEWLTIESTVVSLGEQDLFDRIRYGFVLSDANEATVDREEAWYASHPDYLDRTFRRGERYLYYIVGELEARKMPLELALLPIVESAFNPTALSHSAAAGLWQFIPSTGKRFGLKQNNYYDGRRDVVESTRAALDYFQFLATEFDGDWYLAIAAYNAGEMNVMRAVERNRAKGLPTDFFSLDLPRETEAYVPKLLAMRRIVADPTHYGLEFGSLQNQPYFVKVDVGGQIDLALAAELAGMSQEDFLAINPGFKRRVTDPSGPHQLLIPVQNEQLFLGKLATLPADKRVPVVFYRVHKGDTLNKIATRYGLSVNELASLNNLKSKSVRPGQELLLRGGHMTAAVASTLAATEEVLSTTANKHSAKHSTSAGTGKLHTVRSGETVWSIARQYDIDPGELASVNHVRSNAIKAGQKLRIPQATNSATNDSRNDIRPTLTAARLRTT